MMLFSPLWLAVYFLLSCFESGVYTLRKRYDHDCDRLMIGREPKNTPEAALYCIYINRMDGNPGLFYTIVQSVQ